MNWLKWIPVVFRVIEELLPIVKRFWPIAEKIDPYLDKAKEVIGLIDPLLPNTEKRNAAYDEMRRAFPEAKDSSLNAAIEAAVVASK